MIKAPSEREAWDNSCKSFNLVSSAQRKWSAWSDFIIIIIIIAIPTDWTPLIPLPAVINKMALFLNKKVHTRATTARLQCRWGVFMGHRVCNSSTPSFRRQFTEKEVLTISEKQER